MSGVERERMNVMAGVAEEVTLIAASGLMGLSYRQGKRIWRRYQDEGDAGLMHRLRGKPSVWRKPSALRKRVLSLCEEERYEEFGPTLMAEQLLKAKLVVGQPGHSRSAEDEVASPPRHVGSLRVEEKH